MNLMFLIPFKPKSHYDRLNREKTIQFIIKSTSYFRNNISWCYQIHVNIKLILTTLKYFCINRGDQRACKFEIIINDLDISLRIIWKPICYGYTATIHILFVLVRGASLDVRFRHLKTVPALKGLRRFSNWLVKRNSKSTPRRYS